VIIFYKYPLPNFGLLLMLIMFGDLRHTIVTADRTLWFYINSQWHTPFFDWLLPFFRNQWLLTPVYFFLLLFMPSRFGKKGWLWCLFFLSAFAISDQVSAGLLKPYFHRLRPCQNHMLDYYLRLLVPCGGKYGFPSSHASNHFALAIFSAITLRKYAKCLLPVVVFYAALVCYAQVYVGVHYPLDVFVGACLGSLIGMITASVFNSRIGLDPAGKALNV